MAKRKAEAADESAGTFRTTGISLPRDLRVLLRAVAKVRIKSRGGRQSSSAVIVGLIREHEAALRREVADATRAHPKKYDYMADAEEAEPSD